MALTVRQFAIRVSFGPEHANTELEQAVKRTLVEAGYVFDGWGMGCRPDAKRDLYFFVGADRSLKRERQAVLGLVEQAVPVISPVEVSVKRDVLGEGPPSLLWLGKNLEVRWLDERSYDLI